MSARSSRDTNKASTHVTRVNSVHLQETTRQLISKILNARTPSTPTRQGKGDKSINRCWQKGGDGPFPASKRTCFPNRLEQQGEERENMIFFKRSFRYVEAVSGNILRNVHVSFSCSLLPYSVYYFFSMVILHSWPLYAGKGDMTRVRSMA